MDKSGFFTDVQLVVISHLKAMHTAEVKRLEAEIQRLGTTVDDLVNLCELDDVAICCCQSCKRFSSECDAYRCEGCSLSLCEGCNTHGDGVHIGVDGDGIARCLECSLLTGVPDEDWE